MKVKQLPEDLILRIAAGEVVERPASILKELIENSLDAGATELRVGIEGAGRTKIFVSDNGCGMTKEDATLALRRHATSKISTLEDLESIATYGFRGEALPSISSISKFRLVTRVTEEDAGWEFVIKGGEKIVDTPKPREPGTTIEVQDLFYNTPARYKFLKTDSTERSHCLKVIEEMAFASLPVTFHVQIEKGTPLIFQGNKPLSERIPEAWGARFRDGWALIRSQTPHFSLEGVVSHPHAHQATTRTQFLYINRRPVQNRRIARAIYEAYRGQLPTQRHPAWVLFLEVNPKTVDVNVHPTKREVKLTHENEIFRFVMEGIRTALSSPPLTGRENTLGEGATHSSSPFRERPGVGINDPLPILKEEQAINTQPWPFPKGKGTEIGDLLYQPVVKLPTLKAIAQINRLYILAEGEEGLTILDQHAAAERITYEKLLTNIQTAKPKTQMLLVPFTWEVARSLFEAVQQRLPLIQSLGFVMEPFGQDAFVIKGYPQALGEKFDLHSLLDGLSDLLNEGQKEAQHRIAAMAACKASVRAGDALDIKECQAILDQLPECHSPLTCPHGRPTFIQMTYPDLAHRFRR